MNQIQMSRGSYHRSGADSESDATAQVMTQQKDSTMLNIMIVRHIIQMITIALHLKSNFFLINAECLQEYDSFIGKARPHQLFIGRREDVVWLHSRDCSG